MSLRIQNNIAALNAHRNLQISDNAMSSSLEKLSSGFRINRAADDAAGLSVAQQMSADLKSYTVASQNVSEANSMLQVGEGAMSSVGDMLTRLKELSTQAASANASSNLTKINAEGNTLIDEIDRIAQDTEYSGTKLSNGSFGVGLSAGVGMTQAQGLQAATGMQSLTYYNIVAATSGAGDSKSQITITATLGGTQYAETVYGITSPTAGQTKDVKFATLGLTLTLNNSYTTTLANTGANVEGNGNTAADFQVGAKNTANDRISVALGSITSTALGLSKDQMLTATNAQSFMATIDSAISLLDTNRGALGASQNRLGYASATLATTIQNTTAAESAIKDVDMSAEMTNLSKNQILMQAGTAMLAQANQAPQMLLSLFK